MQDTRRVTSDVDLLGAWVPVPGYGVLAVNAFVIHAREPVLVDTGLAALRGEFMSALEAAIDPAALRWIWITHADAGHVGNLAAVLRRAPQARLVTGPHGMARLQSMDVPLPPDRVLQLAAGQRLPVGDRELLAVVPPTYDTSEATGLFDTRQRLLFSAHCFGAVLPAPVADAAQLGSAVLRHATELWRCLDAPLGARPDRRALAGALDSIRRLAVRTVLGSHLPPAHSMTERLLQGVAEAAEAPLFVGPDRRALERLFAPGQPVAA